MHGGRRGAAAITASVSVSAASSDADADASSASTANSNADTDATHADASATGTAATGGAPQGERIVESRGGCDADKTGGEARRQELERDQRGYTGSVGEVVPPQVVQPAQSYRAPSPLHAL